MSTAPTDPSPQEFLSQYLGKTLRIHTSDNRIFVGQMKCTDRVSGSNILGSVFLVTNNVQECNIILSLTQEYRPPSEAVIKDVAEKAGTVNPQLSFLNRYVGL